MIFIVTGTQEPFDRMIKVMDEIATVFRDISFIAQVSQSNLSTTNLKTYDFIPPTEFNSYFDMASLIISHGGTGTIFTALEKNKPIIVLPRLAKYGEHRNDHQVATCRVFEALGYINVASDEYDLKLKVENIINSGPYSLHKIGKYASGQLIQSLQKFINHDNTLKNNL